MSDDTRATMSGIFGVLAVIAIALVIAFWLGGRNAKSAPAPAPDTVYVKLTAKSDTVIQRTTRTVTQLRTRIDTVPGDTVVVEKEVLREVVRDCRECAEQLRRHKAHCDSAQRAKDDQIARLLRENAQLKGRRKWYAAAGFGACAALGAAR